MKKIFTFLTALLFIGSMMNIQAADDTYVVAGTSNLFGSNWSTSDTNNQMTLQNGKYRLVKENTGNSSLSVEFKVVKNGSWSTAYPSSNYSITVPAKTKLLIIYTTSNNAVNTYILGGYVGAHGTMTNSSWATIQFTAASNKETASHTYSLSANTTYSFGMRVGASNNWTSNGATFTRTNNSKAITSGSGNCSLKTDAAGDYTFTWTYETNTLTITYPAISYGINYPASPEHYSLASGNPTSGEVGKTIQFTATPDENYFLTVTVNGNTVTGNNNVYSFTMPAQAATVAITATPYRVFDGSTPIYLKADAVSWWMDANAVQKATFTKSDNTTVTVTGALEEGVTYAFTPTAGAYKSVQFSRHNPSNVSEDWGHTGDITLIGTEPKDYVTSFTQNGTTATWSTFIPSPSYTFTAGTTIYYDFTNYKSGINTYVGGVEVWHANTEKVLSQTLEADWKVMASTKLWRSGADGWKDYNCTTLPEDGHNMIVSTDGIHYTWGTYVPTVEPTVDFVSLGSTISLGQTAVFAATSTNVENPVYTFKVKKGNGEYGAAVSSFLFAEEGTYTVQVEVDGDDSKHAEATKEVTVVDGAHVIYFVNNNAWEDVYAHMWGVDPGTEWPGDTMTLTSLETEKNHYTVYAVTFTPNYPNIKFNNGVGVETGNQTIDYTKPYYFNGQWYASLEECDPITVTLSVEKTGYLVNDNATLSATSNLTNATYAYQVKINEGEFEALGSNPYTLAAAGTYTFKVTATGDEGSKSTTQTATIYEPLTLYFVNKEGWTNVNAYFYTPEKAPWPGEAMTLTAATTAKHHYTVYSFTIGSGAHVNAIFNNGNTQTGNLTINAAKPYYYDGEWYATLEEIDPITYVEFDGIDATIPMNTPITLAATSNVTNPTYNYYVKPEGGEYAAISSPYTFDAIGNYTMKVEALENGTGEPAAYREKDIEVYTTYTFTSGTTLYVDFSAVSGDAKGVNYPYNHVATTDPLDYDVDGAGTFKTITFTEDVEWSTLNDFIKTEKDNWTSLKFTLPCDGQNCVVVAEDGASYTWTNYTEPAPIPTFEEVRTGLEINRYYTICMPKAITEAQGATFWSLTYKNAENTMAYLEEETTPLVAGKPYIFQATADQLEVLMEGDAATAPVANGALRGTFSYMSGADLEAVEGSVYMLYNNALRPIGTNNYLAANRAYVLYNELQVVPAAGFAPGKKVKAMPMQPQVTTGIEDMNASETPVKMMINGQLFILRGEKLYDATGRLVK